MGSKLSKKLPSTRRFIALLMTGVYCYLVLSDRIPASEMTPVYSMILGFYFGKSTALEMPQVPKEISHEQQNHIQQTHC